MLAMFLLMFVPLIMMGMATGWPGNLSEPAEVNFGFLLSVRHVMQFGYFVYLLYSLLFYPVVYLLAQHTLGLRPAVNPALPRLAVGFALASTLARGMGIMRWLTSMPVLADRYAEASPAEQQSLVYVYEATNSLMGGIGEILGVGMFAGVVLYRLRFLSSGCFSVGSISYMPRPQLPDLGYGSVIQFCTRARYKD